MPPLDDTSGAKDFLAARASAEQAEIDRQWAAIGTNPAKAPGPEGAVQGAKPNPLPVGQRLVNAVFDWFGQGEAGEQEQQSAVAAQPFTEQYLSQKGLAERMKNVFGEEPKPGGTLAERALDPSAEERAMGIALSFGPGMTEGVRGPGEVPPGEVPKAPAAEAPPARPGEPPPAAAPPPPEAVPAPSAAPPARDIIRLGDPLAPAVEIKPTAREAAMAEVTAGRVAGEGQPVVMGAEPSVMSEQTIHDYLAGARVDNPVKINLERIGSNEDVQDVLAQVSRTIPAQAVQTNDATKALSDALDLTPENFLSGYQGTQLNASETTAMRFMLDSSASQLAELAQAARDPLASTEVKAQFLKAFSVHRSLQAYAEGARSEAGRTLQSWNIMSEQRAGYARSIDEIVRNAQGLEGDLTGTAEKIAQLDPLQTGRFVASSMKGTGKDWFMYGYYNALLSGKTVLKKLISDVGMATWNTVTTGLAEYPARMAGGGNLAPGETGSLLAGYLGSFTDAIRAGGRGLMAGQSQFYKEYSTTVQLPGHELFAPAITTPESAALQYTRAMLPTSWIAGADDFAKVWHYRAEYRRLAWREADGDADKFASLMDNTDEKIHQAALGSALKLSFQAPLGTIGSALQTGIDALTVKLPGTNFEVPFGRMIVPFTKVPFNIAKFNIENSPLGIFMRDTQRVLGGGPSPERDLMLARLGLGTAVSLGVGAFAYSNYITGKGPTDPSLRREWLAAGHQPYSIEIPGLRPFSYRDIEPLGMTIASIADSFNIGKFIEDERDFGTIGSSLSLGIGNAMLSKTYFEGISRFLEALQNPESQGRRWAEGFATQFTPALVKQVAEATDQWQRAHYGFLDTLEANLPFLRNGLPPQRTTWGAPVPVREGFAPLLPSPLAGVLSPIQLGPKPEDMEPIDKWVWENRDAFPLGAQGEPRGIPKMNKTQVFEAPGNPAIKLSQPLNPVQYDRLQVLAGSGSKDPVTGREGLRDPQTGLGAKETLNQMVQGGNTAWDTATPELRAMMVMNVVNKFRNAAKQTLLDEDKNLQEAVIAGLRTRAEALAGAPAR